MRTLVVSDFHLGSRGDRDVLRREPALEPLLEAVRSADRIVLLGDVVELIEGRPGLAMRRAEPVVRTIGQAAGRSREIVIVPGNHDHALVRGWMRMQARRGRHVGPAARLPQSASERLAALASWLKPAHVTVRYPGVWLGEGVYATHGHYVDRHLLPANWGARLRGPFTPLPEGRAHVEDYERAAGPSFAATTSALAVSLPRALGEGLDAAAALARRAAVPFARALPEGLAPVTAAALNVQFRRHGLPAMAQVARLLRIGARELIFGHLHRPGPLPGDERREWRPPGAPRLWNSGSWVYEPLLLAGQEPPHPYWPGGAVVVEGGNVRALMLLEHLSESDLRGG
jgi:UDP-2,3-diacylglucosamine pyrophosphatase LpxH